MASVSLVIQPFVKVDTLEHQLASLLRCTDKEGVNLVLFSDNPAGTSSEYVRKNENVMRRLAEFRASHHSKFNDVIIHRIEENRGPYKTCELAIDFALGLTDFAIFSEDDTVFARDALVWFRRMYESGILDHEDNWAIAGESIYFDAREKQPSAEHVERAKAACIARRYYYQFVPLDFIPSTCFATTRAKWKFLGEVRGQNVGDMALCDLCAREHKHAIFPIVPRVKDVGMLHPDGHSVRVLGADEVHTREPKNTYLLSDDLLDSIASGADFEQFMGDAGHLFQESVLLESFEPETKPQDGRIASRARADLAATYERACALIQAGNRREGRKLLSAIVAESPDYASAHEDLVSLLLPGTYYREVLESVHRLLRPDTYLEIGVDQGATLALAKTASIAVGVDPAMRPLEHALPGGVKLYHMESDAFFERERRESVFGERPLDLAFVDGMHWFEYALRDFANTERWASAGSTILLHDCLPVSRVAAERECRSMLWVGDVWKVVDCLREYRPDLSVRIVPTPPSGLVVVRKLDPSSTVLWERMDEIRSRYAELTYPYEPEEWAQHYPLVENSEAGVREALGL